jgi:hypothetical protein
MTNSMSENEDEMEENDSIDDAHTSHDSRQFVGRYQAKCSTSTGHAKNSLLLLKVLDSHWMRMHGEL